jgi:hypothetical protein
VVSQELARLVRADAAALLRFEPDETITPLAVWNAAGVPVPVGEREPVTAALRRLRDTARPVRCGPTGVPPTGPFAAGIRRLGIRASVAVPIQVHGRVWGISVAASQNPEPFPAATETPDSRIHRGGGHGDQQRAQPRRAGGRARVPLPPPTRAAAGSSATFTTERSNAWSPPS